MLKTLSGNFFVLESGVLMPIQGLVLPESWSKMLFKVSYNSNHSMIDISPFG